jgi:hypothetical protein
MEGPGVCKLCNCNLEQVSHLLINCPFTKVVWNRLYSIYNLKFQWVGTSVSDCFNEWSLKKAAPVSLAAIVCWNIWLERNKVIFEDHTPSQLSVVKRISVSFSWQPAVTKNIPRRVCDFIHIEGATMACFDGALSLPGSVVQQVAFSRLMLRGLPNGT